MWTDCSHSGTLRSRLSPVTFHVNAVPEEVSVASLDKVLKDKRQSVKLLTGNKVYQILWEGWGRTWFGTLLRSSTGDGGFLSIKDCA